MFNDPTFGRLLSSAANHLPGSYASLERGIRRACSRCRPRPAHRAQPRGILSSIDMRAEVGNMPNQAWRIGGSAVERCAYYNALIEHCNSLLRLVQQNCRFRIYLSKKPVAGSSVTFGVQVVEDKLRCSFAYW